MDFPFLHVILWAAPVPSDHLAILPPGSLSTCSVCIWNPDLTRFSPALSCRDITPPGEPLNKNSRPKVAARFPKLSRSHPRETARNVEPQSGDL